jgi:hypothetical protein
MATSLAFVAPPIISGEASHELLILNATVVVDELGGFVPAQCCCCASVMSDRHVAVLAANPLETLWCGHIEVSHVGSAVRSVFGCA